MDGIAAITSRIAEIRGTLAAFNPQAVASSVDDVGRLGRRVDVRPPSPPRSRARCPGPPRRRRRRHGSTADGVPTDLAAYGNGKIPREALSEIGSTGHRMWSPAARQYEALPPPRLATA